MKHEQPRDLSYALRRFDTEEIHSQRIELSTAFGVGLAKGFTWARALGVVQESGLEPLPLDLRLRGLREGLLRFTDGIPNCKY